MSEKHKSTEENTLFNEHLRTIDQVLKKYGVSYSLVGGLALKAIFGEKVNARRQNGTVYDFDALALGPDPETINQSLHELSEVKKGSKVFPDLGIEPIHFSDEPPKHGPFTYLSALRKDSVGQYFLHYKDVEVAIPSETMTVQTRLLNGIPFPVLPEETIYWRYFTRGGNMKPKDFDKLSQLHFHIINNGISQPENRLYRPYFDFLQRVNKRYPERINRWNRYWRFDQRVGDKISGNPLLYWTIGVFRK